MPKQINCCLCFRRCKPNSRRHIPPGVAFKRYAQRRVGRDVTSSDMICGTCTARVYRSLPRTEQHETNAPIINTEHDVDYAPQPPPKKPFMSPKSINLNIPATSRSHKSCVVCHRDANQRNNLINIPQQASSQAFIQSGIFIHPHSRCCKQHIENGFFTATALALLGTKKTNDWFSRSDIIGLLTSIRNMLSTHCGHLNFDVPSFLCDEDYITLTGFSKSHFDEITKCLTSLRKSAVHSVRTCVAVFLIKLRSGLSNKMISVLFGLQISQIQRIICSTRAAFMEDFVPNHLGFKHISHDMFCREHTTNTAKTLFSAENNEAIVVLDGTYIYIQKSSDYKFQRQSCSIHKNRPLVKPMMIVGTDGYILDALGPYFADGSNNDASTTKHTIKGNDEANSWFQQGDMFIVDRGFRDAVGFLEDRGYDVKMPFYLQKGCKQHTTEEANLSRLVTKVRWIVESVNERLKQWKLLDRVVPNTLIPSIGDFVKILCALVDRFRELLVHDYDDASLDNLNQRMLEKSREPNKVKLFLEANNLLHKRTEFKPLEAKDLLEFPKLSMDDLRNITMGVYQIKQASSYTKEHLVDDGAYKLQLYSENSHLVKIKIQSRHCNSRTHSLWIEYNTAATSEPIRGWYCTCKVGARVVGCCAHKASVLWFLGYERHQENPTRAAKIPTDTLFDAADQPATDSDTDSEDDWHCEE